MRCVFRATHSCLCTVCPLLSRITQDTIQPTDTASNRATSTPMPAMKVVELSVHAIGVVTATVELYIVTIYLRCTCGVRIMIIISSVD